MSTTHYLQQHNSVFSALKPGLLLFLFRFCFSEAALVRERAAAADLKAQHDTGSAATSKQVRAYSTQHTHITAHSTGNTTATP